MLDYAALFVEIADAYFQQEAYDDARPIYEALGADPAVSGILNFVKAVRLNACIDKQLVCPPPGGLLSEDAG